MNSNYKQLLEYDDRDLQKIDSDRVILMDMLSERIPLSVQTVDSIDDT